jgi:hypothetical protein
LQFCADGLRGALGTTCPRQILTENGKVFTGRSITHRWRRSSICREHGIDYLLTQPRSPTTCKIERFHCSLRAEFLSSQTAFTNLKIA